MNIKKSLAGLFAGFALLGSIAAPTAMAADPTATISVDVQNPGVFTPYFCALSGGANLVDGLDPSDVVGTGSYALTIGSQPTATTAGSATGAVGICYDDTKSFRPSFDASISADPFWNSAHTVSISASNFSVVTTTKVGQHQWSSQNPPTTSGIGDIGYTKDGNDPGGQFGGATWSPGHTLDQWQRVHFAYAGRGTVVSLGGVGLALNIPSGIPAGHFETTLTLSLTMGPTP